MVVFFDIDGTVIDDDTQQIPQSAVDAIRALGENGHIAVVNTGRPFSHTDPRVRKIPFRGWICGCGMDVRMDGKQIACTQFSEEIRRLAREMPQKYGMEPLYEADDSSIALADVNTTHPFAAKERDRTIARGFAVNSLADHPDFMKFVTWNTPGCRREEYIEVMKPYCTMIFRENAMIEQIPLGCSKAKGMELLLAHLGMDFEDTLAIGDSTNDVPMFEAARHTVCMGGGMEELKAIAEYITAPVMEDGIRKALQHYGLI